MRNFFFILIVLDLLIILYFLTNKDYLYILNTQVALISSLIVTGGSFLGYRRVVLKRAKEQNILDDKDLIDKIEDPYNLYEEELKESQIDAKQIFEEEKKRLKSPKESIKNFILTSSGFLSIYRIFGYLFLVVSVLILIDKKMFDAIAYMVGLSLVPISAMVFTFVRK
ncbi:hypothetical protein [Nitrosophilus labii]|uniref:hypothetical protein n=1 Tax=Nitrosophilus labii TaxID=2706014 RepID=UPI0016572DAD|nr:hypothetical protein [Nitrosophilus labii]